MAQPLAVTGLGIVSALGTDIDTFKSSLEQGTCGIGRMDDSGLPGMDGIPAATIPDLSREIQPLRGKGLPRELAERAVQLFRRSPDGIQASILATLEAWLSSGLFEADVAPDRIGIVVAGHNLNQGHIYRMGLEFRRAPDYLSPRYAMHFMDTDQVGTISELLGLKGEGFTVGGASASGNVAIIKACQSIRAGSVDACLVIGAMADLSPMEIQGFRNIGAMVNGPSARDPLKACRPFDRDRGGFVYGQAGSCLVLESMESVQKRDAAPLAGIIGWGHCLDGNRLANPSRPGEARAMALALESAGIRPDAVDTLNAHGTGSPLGDETEADAIWDIFNGHTEQMWINSTKSLTGHCLWSAGVVEAVVSVLQLRDGFIHPNRNLDTPIRDRFRFCKDRSAYAPIQTAMSNSFGFGGINTSVVFSRNSG